MREYVRLLKILIGEEKDSEGRSLGSDWLLADLGEDDSYHYYLTTNYVRASEFADCRLFESDVLGEFICSKINMALNNEIGNQKRFEQEKKSAVKEIQQSISFDKFRDYWENNK